MKARLTILILSVILLSVKELYAQSDRSNAPLVPFKNSSSILSGKDIIIDDQPDHDQRNVAICSAFNGWLYSIITYVNETYNAAAFTIMKSTDYGMSWTLFLDDYYPLINSRFTSVDIVTTGKNISDLKVVFSYVVSTGSSDVGQGCVMVYDGVSGNYLNRLIFEAADYDISLASDYLYSGSQPNASTLGILSSTHIGYKDSVLFRSSNDGGFTLDNHQIIALTGNRFHRLSLSYGRSSSWDTGRFFAIWEENADFGSIPGHLYTAHSIQNYNSSFSNPINLDSISNENINNCSNPAIACQYNCIDNDSSNITEIILFETYNPAESKKNVKGLYNLQAVNSNQFLNLKYSDSTHHNLQPSICFNAYDTTFLITYYDSTIQKLPLLGNDFNLKTPNQWNVLSNGYNDSADLSFPFPKVAVNTIQEQGANVWIANLSGGNGVALFDATYNTWTGVSPNNADTNIFINTYPNPCTDHLNVAFKLSTSKIITIKIYNILGELLKTISSIYIETGNEILDINTANYASGTYIILIYIDNKQYNSKFSKLEY